MSPSKRVAEDEVARTLRHRLKWLRQTHGQSLETVAKGTQFGLNTVQRQESGAGRVDVTALVRYARHFGVTVGWLLGLEGCGTCNGKPPIGFTCRACGSDGTGMPE